MPEYLSKFEFFFDFKGIADSLSKMAMEAHACGCKVLHDRDPYGDPINAVPTTTKEDYLELYLSLRSASRWKAIKRIPRVLFSNHIRLFYVFAGLMIRKVNKI